MAAEHAQVLSAGCEVAVCALIPITPKLYIPPTPIECQTGHFVLPRADALFKEPPANFSFAFSRLPLDTTLPAGIIPP